MSKQQALFQALAASNALLMIFIAVCHEVVGARLFPYGPALFGGPLGWHATGIFGMALGALIFAGALGLIRFPVARWALFLAGIGLVVALITALGYQEFHLFAVTLVLAGLATAFFHRRACQLAAKA